MERSQWGHRWRWSVWGGQCPPLEEYADHPDFNPEHAHLLLQGVYGDFLHHNNVFHLDWGVADNALWQCHWRRIAAQSAIWYATPSVTVGCRFTAIFVDEWRGVIGRSWNSERPLVFAHVILTKTLGVCRAQEIRARIVRRMDLWERYLQTGLVGDAKAKGAVREGRAASAGEEDNEAAARSYQDTVFSGKLRQAVRQATNREGGGCLLLDGQCTKTRRPVAEVLQ